MAGVSVSTTAGRGISPCTEENLCVVRLRRSWWRDNHGLHQRTDLRYVKRECMGYNILADDASNIGAAEVMPQILNLDECKDGLYYVTTCNIKRDWETGCIEEYDYRLMPYVPVEKPKEAVS